MKTLESLQAMSDEELTELCTEMMGFGGEPKLISNNGKAFWSNEWNPLRSWDDTMSLVKNAKSISIDHIIGYDGKDVGWRALVQIGDKIKQAQDKSPQRAIVIASLLASA